MAKHIRATRAESRQHFLGARGQCGWYGCRRRSACQPARLHREIHDAHARWRRQCVQLAQQARNLPDRSVAVRSSSTACAPSIHCVTSSRAGGSQRTTRGAIPALATRRRISPSACRSAPSCSLPARAYRTNRSWPGTDTCQAKLLRLPAMGSNVAICERRRGGLGCAGARAARSASATLPAWRSFLVCDRDACVAAPLPVAAQRERRVQQEQQCGRRKSLPAANRAAARSSTTQYSQFSSTLRATIQVANTLPHAITAST